MSLVESEVRGDVWGKFDAAALRDLGNEMLLPRGRLFKLPKLCERHRQCFSSIDSGIRLEKSLSDRPRPIAITNAIIGGGSQQARRRVSESGLVWVGVRAFSQAF
jgi:hypothetical protein